MMRNYFKHIIFDFDGTIANSMRLAIDLFNQTAPKYKFKTINEQSFEYLYELSIMEKCKALNVSLACIPRAAIDLQRSYSRQVGDIPIIAGMREVILALDQLGYTLSIISSNAGENIKKFLINNDINIFDHIYSGRNPFGKDKTIGSFIKKNNIQKGDVVYIGDEVRDIVACRANNIKIIAVTWGGYDSLKMLRKASPDFLVNDPGEIISII